MTGFFFKFLSPRPEAKETELVFVLLPGAIEPEQRDGSFGDPLDAELRLAGIGYVSGGGSLLSAPDTHENRTILFAGVDVDATDVEAVRELLRDHLPELGCPSGTRIQYDKIQDRFDGEHWHLGEPRNDDV